ncbi:MAG: hypothetical protein U1E81_13235 [Xanthobacteraceae bacterium]
MSKAIYHARATVADRAAFRLGRFSVPLRPAGIHAKYPFAAMGLAGPTSGRDDVVTEPIVSFMFLRIDSPSDAAETFFAEAVALLDRSAWRRPQRYFSWSHDIRMRLFVTAALVFSI